MDQNQSGQGSGRGRRGHFHRGRRPDRRGQGSQDSRPPAPSEARGARSEHVDVEQVMRDIRARIAHQHGIELSAAQIQELAARRLEALLDPRNVNPSLLEQLRRAAGERPVRPTPKAAQPAYTFEDTTLYESSRGLLTAIRRFLNPLLKLFFNPNPLIHALNTQVRLNTEQAARESERDERQTEWNALYYELLRRSVTESARLSLEVQALSLQVESLAARVDFADRRVRAMEAMPPARHHQRQAQEPQQAAAPSQAAQAGAADAAAPVAPAAGADVPGSIDPQKRRRRRRRGRRNGPSFGDTIPGVEGSTVLEDAAADGDGEETEEHDTGGRPDVPELPPASPPLEADAPSAPWSPAAPASAAPTADISEAPVQPRPDEPGDPQT